MENIVCIFVTSLYEVYKGFHWASLKVSSYPVFIYLKVLNIIVP